MSQSFYISTSIAYVNAKPHIGFALECIMADAIARYKRIRENDVFFLTGTDEHGVKIYKTAQSENKDTKVLCDENAEFFHNLMNVLHISNDDFIRTSDKEKHWPSVSKLWQKLEANGDIYKKSYHGKYCEGCECFIPEKDLVDLKCPNHQKELTIVEEENYFFKLSKYSDQILKKIESKELEIIPEFRQNEIVTMLKDNGLKDVSFSRPAETLPWGIPVPGDKSQNMYVWCDALTNYISALDYANEGELYIKYWKNVDDRVHVIGKDIVRFHAGIWIGMLISANIPLPKKILIHGFLTSEGKKMSKSLGNVVDPFNTVEIYGVDAIRYFLLSQVPTGHDYDFKREQFEKIYNAHLANNLGNLINRVAVLCEKNSINNKMINNTDIKLTKIFKEKLKNTWDDIETHMIDFSLYKVMEDIFKIFEFANKQMDEIKPWILAKENPEKLKSIMPLFLELIRQLAFMLEAFLPETSNKIKKTLGVKETNNYKEKITWNGQSLWDKPNYGGVVLFPRLMKN